jgi:hypothetical protein
MSSNSTAGRAGVIASMLAMVVLASAAPAASRTDVIRILDSCLTGTFHDMYAASPAARRLVDRLERSDLVLHVVSKPFDRRPFTGTMTFVVRAGGRRFLRIAIDARLPPDRRAAALAHELQHALEVADDTTVVDHASFATLYRRIGHESGGDSAANCFETVAALRTGARVLAEFRAATSGR